MRIQIQTNLDKNADGEPAQHTRTGTYLDRKVDVGPAEHTRSDTYLDREVDGEPAEHTRGVGLWHNTYKWKKHLAYRYYYGDIADCFYIDCSLICPW